MRLTTYVLEDIYGGLVPPPVRLEYRSDMLLSTLKRFVQATGGELHLVVQYPNGAPVELLVADE